MLHLPFLNLSSMVAVQRAPGSTALFYMPEVPPLAKEYAIVDSALAILLHESVEAQHAERVYGECV